MRKIRAPKPIAQTPPPAPTPPPTVGFRKPPGKLACSKCGTPGHNSRSCGRAPKGKTIAPHVATAAKKPWAAALERTREARKQLDTYEGDE